MRERISDDANSNSSLATSLIRSCIRPGHDFGGAAQFQKPVGNPLQKAINGGFSHFAVKPSRFLTVDDLLHCLESTDVPKSSNGESTIRCSLVPDAFSRLPTGVIHLLLSWLPCDDIRHLRLASKSIASVSNSNSLPQSFWRSRFSRNFEMGFALPILTDGHQDWRSLRN